MRILNQDILKRLLSEIGCTEQAIGKMLETAEKIYQDESLTTIFQTYYRTEILTGNWTSVWHIEEPHEEVGTAFGEEYTLFYLLCYLETLPDTRERYFKLGIPMDVYRDTLADIGIWLENWKRMYGYYCFRNLGWIWRHLDCQLFRIGRLQYQLNSYQDHAVVYQHINTGHRIAFFKQPVPINHDGNMVGAGGRQDDRTAFMTVPVKEQNGKIYGTPISPYGKVENRTISLPLKEWNCILKQGDSVLELHIPRADHLLMADCKVSYRDALVFYRRYFHAVNIAGLVCHTWLFTPQLQEMLPQQSNIVQFQREFYLLPHAGDYHFMWNFVFDETVSLEQAPSDSFLRRKLISYMKNDRLLFDLKGLCLHGWEDWGSQTDMCTFDRYGWPSGI